MSFRLFNDLPDDMKNEAISKLTIRELISMSQASKEMRRLVENLPLWKSIGATNFVEFMQRTKALPIEYRHAVLDQEMPLKSAEMLQLDTANRIKKIFSSNDISELKRAGITDDRFGEMAGHNNVACMWYEKLITVEDIIVMANLHNQSYDKLRGFNSFIESNDGIKAVRHGLISIREVLGKSKEDVNKMLTNGFHYLHERADFLANKANWKNSGVLDQNEFEARFKALPLKFQEYIMNQRLSLSASEFLQSTSEERLNLMPTEVRENLNELKSIFWSDELPDTVAVFIFENIVSVSDILKNKKIQSALNTFKYEGEYNSVSAIKEGLISFNHASSMPPWAVGILLGEEGMFALRNKLITSDEVVAFFDKKYYGKDLENEIIGRIDRYQNQIQENRSSTELSDDSSKASLLDKQNIRGPGK